MHLDFNPTLDARKIVIEVSETDAMIDYGKTVFLLVAILSDWASNFQGSRLAYGTSQQYGLSNVDIRLSHGVVTAASIVFREIFSMGESFLAANTVFQKTSKGRFLGMDKGEDVGALNSMVISPHKQQCQPPGAVYGR